MDVPALLGAINLVSAAQPFGALGLVQHFPDRSARSVSKDADLAPGRVPFKAKPRTRLRRPPAPSGPVPETLVPRRPLLGIETAIRAGSVNRERDETMKSTRTKRSAKARRDVHAEITEQLIKAIEADLGTPQMPWRRSARPRWMPTNARTGNPYNGVNIVSLWVAAEVYSFEAPIWATYRQWQELNCQVRKGEKSSLVIFYKEFDVEPDHIVDEQSGQKLYDANDDGHRRVARASPVFNASQVDGFELPTEPDPLPPIERIACADRFVNATKAKIEHGGDRAFYRPSTDHIQMPDEHRFAGTSTMTREEGYYATLLHELTHWSGAKHRLDRQFGERFGDAAYAAEELVAEIASAFLSAELNISQDTRHDHAQYLAQWLKILKEDCRAIFTAATKASEAVAYLKALQR